MTARHLFSKTFSDGWFSRVVLLGIFWYVWRILEWAMAFSSTALAAAILQEAGKHPVDLMAVAANIGAVGVIPPAIVTLGLKWYMDMKAAQTVVVKDRRDETPT